MNAEYGQKAQTGGHVTQTRSWVISWKQNLVERNVQKFGPTGLYIKHTNAENGQNTQTGSH